MVKDRHARLTNLIAEMEQDEQPTEKAVAMIINAIYTSVFDDCIVCSSACKYDTERKLCFDIETAANANEAEAPMP